MTQEEFKEKWENGLTAFLKDLDETRINGFTRKHKDGKIAKHDYIIRQNEGENELDLIKKYNVLYYEQDFERLVGKVHSMARHLNSSQVMCYNFFRPMMSVSTESNIGYANKKLVNFIKDTLGIDISEKAKCRFEYEDISIKKIFKEFVKNGQGEKSQFDFFIEDDGIKIYLEIKFTESSFGGWSKNKSTSDTSVENHCIYIQNGYKKMLKDSPYFSDECKKNVSILTKEDCANNSIFFNKQYQLFRNALRADESSYTVFIFPKANPKTQQEFDDFSLNLRKGQNHIIALNWEDLTPYMEKVFIKKYLSYFV